MWERDNKLSLLMPDKTTVDIMCARPGNEVLNSDKANRKEEKKELHAEQIAKRKQSSKARAKG
jgi:hypothetical protein